jgi:hypothetical protein
VGWEGVGFELGTTALQSGALLTLIVLGEVKVDLANFDVKFPISFLCIRLKEIPIPAEMSYESF